MCRDVQRTFAAKRSGESLGDESRTRGETCIWIHPREVRELAASAGQEGRAVFPLGPKRSGKWASAFILLTSCHPWCAPAATASAHSLTTRGVVLSVACVCSNGKCALAVAMLLLAMRGLH